MKVELLKPGAGFGYAHEAGEIIEVSDEKGAYMIECGAAVEIESEKPKAKKK